MKSEAVYYIEPYYHEKYNPGIEKNFQSIEDFFEQKGLSFVYLPKLMIDKHFNEVLEYNRPYLKNSSKCDLPKLYQLIISQYQLKVSGPALLYLSDEPGELQLFELPSDAKDSLLFDLYPKTKESRSFEIPSMLTESRVFDLSFPEDFISKTNFNRIPPSSEENISGELISTTAFYTFIEEISAKSAEKHRDSGIRFKKGGHLVTESAAHYTSAEKVDADFQREAFVLPPELEQHIYKLREAGYLLDLIELLEKLNDKTRKLSRLRISADYKIYLTDYQNKEVKMTPLPKALFFLFVNHPEGILFKQLADYRKELMEIYQTISLRENMDKVRQSIVDMTDPLNNSINEKCSMIRNAFLKVISDGIATNYYITGERGEVKRIKLDRELVVRG
ncbi:MAG: hypothetical protein PHF38_04135 [Bacteroidales bacterium]|nr:hypothetical protein [Bacteroidales bacterium]MDD4430821.1 hypothetical protein [Bacteroidales bacterium]